MVTARNDVGGWFLLTIVDSLAPRTGAEIRSRDRRNRMSLLSFRVGM